MHLSVRSTRMGAVIFNLVNLPFSLYGYREGLWHCKCDYRLHKLDLTCYWCTLSGSHTVGDWCLIWTESLSGSEGFQTRWQYNQQPVPTGSINFTHFTCHVKAGMRWLMWLCVFLYNGDSEMITQNSSSVISWKHLFHHKLSLCSENVCTAYVSRLRDTCVTTTLWSVH